MNPAASPQKQLSSRQVSAAAENLAAAQFSLFGFDILEHPSRARFAYLGVAKSGGMMKVMVHGSLDGLWDLVEPYLESRLNVKPSKRDYHRAIDQWLKYRGRRVVCCLVKLEPPDLRQMPRLYLASTTEIAKKLHEIVEHVGVSALYEEYEIADSYGTRRIESLPAKWRLSAVRIADLMRSAEGEKPLRFSVSAAVADAA